MTTRRVLVVAVAAVIGAQLAVPAVALLQDKPARFGFQMYSGYGEGSITVLDAAGDAIDFDASALLPRPLRPELDWRQYVPEHFCAQIPGAERIVIEQDLTGRSEMPCP